MLKSSNHPSHSLRTAGFIAVAVAMLAGAAAAQGPTLRFTTARATGVAYSLAPVGDPIPHVVTYTITDTLPAVIGSSAPRDTVASHSRLDFAWNATPLPPATAIVSYAYKFDAVGAVSTTVDSSVHSVSFNNGALTDSVTDGVKLFMLRATDNLGHSTTITRWFVMNFAPETWWSGPDPSLVPVVPGSGGQRFLAIADWTAPPALDGSLFNCDSLHLLPASRPNRRAFFEIFEDRLYVRSEGDTVHQNSWLLFHNGGFDRDSPYAVHVAPNQLFPQTQACALYSPNVVLQPGPPNGSPIGFSLQVGVVPTFRATGVDLPSFTIPYPWFDYASVFHNPVIAGYWLVRRAGRAYAIATAIDGSGAFDSRIPSARVAADIVAHVEAGVATPTELALRPLILTFYVDRGPIPDFGHLFFFPKSPAYNGGQIALSPSRVLKLQYYVGDPDPFATSVPFPPGGGPIFPEVFRYTTTVIGRDVDAHLVSVTLPPVMTQERALSQTLNLDTTVPRITSREVTVRLELCDCDVCEGLPGSGRCETFDIPVLTPALVGVDPGPMAVFSLDGLRPNPAHGRDANIHFSLAVAGDTRIELFDMAGRRVWAQRSRLEPGAHEAHIGRVLAPGVYLVRLSHPAGERSVRALVLN